MRQEETMRFFHLSDLHIGAKLYEYDLLEDQRDMLLQIVELAAAHQPDAVVIAGDVYDRSVPAVEAVALFDSFMAQLRQAVPSAALMLISGNHDSPQRLDVFREALGRQQLYMIGNPPQQEGERVACVTLHDDWGAVNFHLLPFIRPGMVRRLVGTKENGDNLSYQEAFRRVLALSPIDPAQRNVLVSHQFFLPSGQDAAQVERAEIETRTVGNLDVIPADVIAAFDYAALGHIHKPMKVGCETLRYCGSPMAYSLSEEGQQKGVLLVEMAEKGNVTTTLLPLHQRHAVRRIRGSVADVLAQSSEDYVAVTLTDAEAAELGSLRESLRQCFPRLLEIRRERQENADAFQAAEGAVETLSPYELCLAFAGARLCEEEKALLAQALGSIEEVDA